MTLVIKNPINLTRCGAFRTGSPSTTSGWSGAIRLDDEIEDTGNMHETGNEDTGTATGTQSSTTLQDTSKVWTVNQFAGYNVVITAGTGAAQIRRITSNTADTLTVPTWTVTPDATSTYIIYKSSRITIPAGKSGWYNILAKGTFTSGGAGVSRGIRIDVNGVFEVNNFVPVLSVETSITLAYGLLLNAGDYVEMQLWQDTGATKATIGGKSRLFLQVIGQ